MNEHPGDDAVRAVLAEIGAELPASYEAHLAEDREVVTDLAVIYGASDVVEMNRLYYAARYLPDHFIIGDNGGGEAYVIEKRGGDDTPVHIIEHGSMVTRPLRPFADSFADWRRRGFPVDEEADDDETATGLHGVDPADVYLDAMPPDGLKGLVRIKKILELDTSIGELKKRAESLPARLAAGVPYMRYVILCEKANAPGACLSIRPPS